MASSCCSTSSFLCAPPAATNANTATSSSLCSLNHTNLQFLPFSNVYLSSTNHHPKLGTHTYTARASVATKPEKSPAEEDWNIKREYLVKNQVRSVTAKEAYRLQKQEGYVLLDVRPEGEFKEVHPEGAINVQVYRLIKEWTAWDIARRAAFAFFGIFAGTEENPDFLKDVNTKIGKDKKIIVACSAGGTMKPTATLAEGQQSRSLIAAYLLKLDGFKTILHLEGGLRSWFKDEDLPVVSSD